MKIFNLCFTGLSGSGKTTLATEVWKALEKMEIPTQIIDGDDTRKEIGNLFGYTKEERIKMTRVNRMLAKYLNQNQISTLIAIVAPFEEMRQGMREYFGDSYIEVYVKCSSAICAMRDVKGYYEMQKKGEISNLSGADDIYEIPARPEIIVNTEKEAVGESAEKIIRYLIENGYGT